MAEESYYLEFQGYWRAINGSSIPNDSGVYCVYACNFNQKTKTVELHELIYIGESEHVRDQILFHNSFPNWVKELKEGQELCFAFAHIDSETVPDEKRRSICSFLRHIHQPKCNEVSDTEPPNIIVTVSMIGDDWNLYDLGAIDMNSSIATTPLKEFILSPQH